MKIINIKKDFADFQIDVSGVTMENGLIHGLIGPNGCGKTTLGKLIIDTVPSEKREIDFEGLSSKDITMTSQKPYMLHDTVLNNLLYPLKLRGINPDEAEIDWWLSLCGLEDKKKAYARNLSSGQQQKLSIARSLIFKPKLVIIDESLSNLDLDSVELFESVILDIQKTRPVTWIVISHQLAHVRKLCDRIHFMDRGRVIKSGTTDEVLSNPHEPEIIRYLKHETIQ
jgi:ABC-type multidrug transport system ATPase subunit